MKRLAALITAFVLMVSFCAVTASAAKYGRDPYESDITAKGNYVYYFSDNKICRLHITDGKYEILSEPDNDGIIENLSILGNCLYYTSYDGNDNVYKLDIDSGKQTKILDCGDSQYEISVESLITAGDRIYIIMSESVHDEVNDRYYVDIYDTDGKYLGNFTPCTENYSFFVDASNCEACAAAKEMKVVYTSDDEDYDSNEWYLEYTGVYNIVKIKSDLSEERINIPAKIGKNVKEIVYCGKKYIYYRDVNYRLCRYNTETEKKRVLVDGEVAAVHYKNGTIYFFAENGDLKKYEKGKVSTVKKYPENASAAAYFFDEYILYYVHDNKLGGHSYSIIYYSGKKTMSVDLAKKA